jgi:hypothetical protein
VSPTQQVSNAIGSILKKVGVPVAESGRGFGRGRTR